MTGKIIRRKILKFVTALWPERSAFFKQALYDSDYDGEKDGSESNYSNAAADLCGQKRIGRSFGADRRRSAGRFDDAIYRASQTSVHRGREIAQLRECLFERRRHSLYGQGSDAGERWRRGQHRSFDCWRQPLRPLRARSVTNNLFL